MSTVPREEPQVWVKGTTAPLLETQFVEEDGKTPMNLLGYAGRGVFWYVAGAAPHKVGSAVLPDAANGLVRYDPDATETPSAGRMIYQIEVMNPGSPDSTVEEWGTATTGPFKVLVLDGQP